MSSESKKPLTRRQLRANSFYQQKLSSVILTADYPGISGVVTITRVECAPDLRDAKVWVSCVGQPVEDVLKILRRHIYEIQGELYRGSTVRIVPRITLHIDRDLEYAAHMEEVLRNLKHE